MPKTKSKPKKAAPSLAVEPSEVALGSYVHIFGEFPVPRGDTEIVVEAIYPTASPISYELGPPHEGGELSVRVGTLEVGEVLVRAFSVEFSGEGDQRVAGERTALGTATFTVV